MSGLLRNAVRRAAWGIALLLGGCGDDFQRGEPFLTGGGTDGSGSSTSVSSGSTEGASGSSTGSSTGPGTTGGSTGAGPGTTGGGGDEVCYPGPAMDWSLCLPVVELDPVPPDYVYGPAYQDNPNYRPPIRFLDLEALDPSAELAPNFTLDELAQVAKGRYAVMQPHAVASLQGLRDQIGAITVNSGYRSPAYNQMIGGATYSRHMYGDAFDMKPANATLGELEVLCDDAGGMLVQYDTHVHCDFRFDPVNEVFFGPEEGWMPAELPPMGARLEVAGQVWTAPAWGFDEGDPLRRWIAWGGQGQVLARGEGPEFIPPPGTEQVVVDVGGQVVLSSVDAGP